MKEIKLITCTRSIKAKRQDGFCKHYRVEVDEKSRTVNCLDCQRVIDPFEYVWRWAMDESRYEMEVTWKKRELEKLQSEYEELSKTVSYMRSKKRSSVKITKLS